MRDFVKSAGAMLKRWWTYMSCAVFTFLGLYVAYFGKSNRWLIAASTVLAIALMLFAAYQVWHDEHRENARLKSDEARKIRLHEIKERLSWYAMAGTKLVDQAPPSPNEVPAWKDKVNAWANEANDYILQTCSQLASNKFRHVGVLHDSSFPGKHSDTWPVLRVLRKMSSNLRETIENEQTYLTVIK